MSEREKSTRAAVRKVIQVQDTDTLMLFAITIARVTQQGSGLLWEDVRRIIQEEVNRHLNAEIRSIDEAIRRESEHRKTLRGDHGV